jgi:hypothetical protein
VVRIAQVLLRLSFMPSLALVRSAKARQERAGAGDVFVGSITINMQERGLNVPAL